MITAAGILFVTPDRKALFLQRSEGGDMPGYWCVPGGKLEDGETVEECAVRETTEEAGSCPDGPRVVLTRTVSPRGPDATPDEPATSSPVLPSPVAGDEVDFTTFIQKVEAPFDVVIEGEHTGYAWASLDNPPQPIHPGVAVALARLGADELDIARMMSEGDLPSPQSYENIALFLIRITGTNVAYRSQGKEFVFRDPNDYMNERFIARCQGLPVIMEHPKTVTLTSDEFADRMIGTTFLPFLPSPKFLAAHPQAKDDEVWAVVKIYDAAAVQMMTEDVMSTSPAVVFHDPTVNMKVTLEDGSPFLIEGVPSLLDHIAVCPLGVWDKGDKPTGVISDSATPINGDNTMATEDNTEDKKADAAPEPDAKGDATQDKILAKLDSMCARMDAFEDFTKKKADAAEPEPKEDKKADADKEPDVVADKRKDSEDEAEKKADAQRIADTVDSIVSSRIAELEKRLPKSRSDSDFAAMSAVQARADAVMQMFGDSASRPLDGEDLNAYRLRSVRPLQKHSAALKDVNLSGVNDAAAFTVLENQIYADAQAAALRPADIPRGQLRPIRTTDSTGRTITSFAGEPASWMRQWGGQRRRVTAFNKNPNAATA